MSACKGACDGMFKQNVEIMNKVSTSSVDNNSYINFLHTRLCHINSKYTKYECSRFNTLIKKYFLKL